MRERSLGRFVSRAPTEMPSTVIVPFGEGFEAVDALDQRRLLPEPDGPQITTTSPLAMFIEQFFQHLELAVPFADVFYFDHSAYLRRKRLTSREALKQSTRNTRATNR